VLVGTYDASTFVEGDYATYPQLPAGVTLYQPAMSWLVTVAGTVYGQAAAVDDRLFAMPSPRPYGSFTFGDKRYGGSGRDGDWEVDEVWFLVWDAHAAPPDQVPYPNAGCPFTEPWHPLGEWAPGWRIVVDAFYNVDTEARTYGVADYGDRLYGSVNGQGAGRWVDITEPSFHIEIGDGMQEGGPRVTVAEVDIVFLDPVGTWFDIATPATWFQPQPGTAIRVGLLDPVFRYHPLITATIERIEDTHDGEHPRTVSVRGFGRIMDLVVDVPGLTYASELASTRFNALAAMAGWYWDNGVVAFPATGDAALLAEAEPKDIVVRDEMDRTCQSVGWFLDADRRGRMRVRPWPHEPTVDVLPVTDCHDGPGLVSHSLTFANDQSQLLNYVVTSNTAQPAPANVIEQDTVSIARFGKRGRAFGFPLGGMAWADAATARTWVQRVRDRYKFVTRQCESFEVDTHVDQAWLPALADLDTGRGVRVERTGMRPLVLDGVVVGWRYRLDPGRWGATVFVSTITESL
jgi:hypothetical protein